MQNLRAIRERRGWSQTELATRAGVSQVAVSRIEQGNMNATLRTVSKLADALGVAPYTLFSISALQERVIDAVEHLPPEKQDAALVVLESMARPEQ